MTRYWYDPHLYLPLIRSTDSIIEPETVIGKYILTSAGYYKKPLNKRIETGNEMKNAAIPVDNPSIAVSDQQLIAVTLENNKKRKS